MHKRLHDVMNLSCLKDCMKYQGNVIPLLPMIPLLGIHMKLRMYAKSAQKMGTIYTLIICLCTECALWCAPDNSIVDVIICSIVYRDLR